MTYLQSTRKNVIGFSACIREMFPGRVDIDMIGYNNVSQTLVIIYFALFIYFLPNTIFAYDFEDCYGCHDTSLRQDTLNPYLHTPFLEKKCAECHVAEAEIDHSQEKQRIDWLSESAPEGNTHAFRFPDNDLGEILIVDIIAKQGQSTRHEFTVPSFKNLVEFEDSGIPPNISNVKVISIDQGIFLTATVEWATDTLTSAVAYYGENDLSQESDTTHRYGRQHQIVLRNLNADKTYRFTAHASDLFGRRQESEPITFSTSVLSSTEQPGRIDAQSSKDNPDKIATSFYKIGEDILIEISLNQTTKFFLGTKGEKVPCLPEDEFHDGLSCIEVSSMAACLNCHNRHAHPLNVAPRKKGIVIPKEFPTFSGGRIVCTTCHNPHSSKNLYFTRKDRRKVLCASCHRTYAK